MTTMNKQTGKPCQIQVIILLLLLLLSPGLRSTRITESPRSNILAMYLSLLTGRAFFLPFPVLGVSVHISLTFSSPMLKCRSNAFTQAKIFQLFLQLISTWVLCFTDCVNTETGPVRVKLLLFLSHSCLFRHILLWFMRLLFTSQQNSTKWQKGQYVNEYMILLTD